MAKEWKQVSLNIRSHMKSCDRTRRSKEVCQVRENTAKDRGIVYGFKNEARESVSRL